LRPLEEGDYDKGIMKLLGQLSVEGNVSKEMFIARFRERAALPGVYHTMVIEDTSKRRIVASATIFLEKKFLRSCGVVGHVEDVVVDSTYRGFNLGIRIMESLTAIGWAYKCYKIILDCSDKNTSFYEKLGFAVKERQMVIYAPSASASVSQ